MTSTQRLASWCALTTPTWSDASLKGARNAMLDTVAVMLAGEREVGAQSALNAVRTWGSGRSLALGSGGQRLAAPWAALVNGTAAHVLDYDDVLDPAMAHPSAVLVPAVLALAEEIEASGVDCLDAYLVGFEVMSRLGEAMNLVHYQRGWHTTLSLGSSAAAAACGRLLRLDANGMAMALSLSTSMAGGSKTQFGTLAKPLHAGLAAKNGMIAAKLASSGVTGCIEPFEGRWGYIDMMAGPEASGLTAALDKLGRVSAMEQYGIWQKLYPCCASTHRPVDALRVLAPLRETVAGITVQVSEIAAANLRYRIPANVPEARFSLPYCLAATLTDGMLTPSSFTPEAVLRNDLVPLMELVDMRIDPELPGNRAVSESFERGTVTVLLTNGERLQHVVVTPRGHPGDPLSHTDLDAKFDSCVSGILPAQQATHVLEMLHDFGRLERIGALTRLLH